MDEDPDSAYNPCPECGTMMYAIRGSFNARCKNCGFKDACCF
jgi:DNA-directed RNA polymerase subunit RPC12/RpoP